MKMLVIVYNDAVDEVMISTFKKADVHGYTKWKETLGEGIKRSRNWEPIAGQGKTMFSLW